MRTTIAGVEYWQASGKNGASGSVQPAPTPSRTFTPPAVRRGSLQAGGSSARPLGREPDNLDGIGHGSGASATDCHSKGHCIDFYGATTSRAGVLDVKRDWYLHPVYLANGKLHPPPPHKPQDGLAFDYDRWGIDNQTSYRLLLPKDEVEKLPSAKDYYNTKARDFFADVYTFVSEECAFGSSDISPASFKAGTKPQARMYAAPRLPVRRNASITWITCISNWERRFSLPQAAYRTALTFTLKRNLRVVPRCTLP